MIRYKLALAGVLIAPALAPAQRPNPAGPASPFGSGPLLKPGQSIVKEDFPLGVLSSTALLRREVAPDDPLQANFGLRLAPADDALRAQLELAPGRGVVVVGVKPGGLAEQAGLKPNDVLTRLGDREVDGVESARMALLGLGEETLEVKLIREGKPGRMSLVGPEHGFPPESAEFWIGVPVSPVDPTLASHLPALKSGVGLIVNDVVKGSPAEVAGLLKNDILATMDGKPLTNRSLIEQIQASQGRPMPLEILRGGKPLTITVTPARRAHPTTINLPGGRPPSWAYRLFEPGVAVEVKPVTSTLSGKIRLGDAPPPNPGRWNAETFHFQPDVKYDAIVVNPHRVDGADAAGQPYGIRLQMTPRTEAIDAAASARIEARLDEIAARLEDLRRAVEAIKKAEGK